jgi:hypothetical protein
MSNVLLVQNSKSEGSGYLGDLLKNEEFLQQLQIIIQSLTKV